jgi:hypothetical protein
MNNDILNWWLRITESEAVAMVIIANDRLDIFSSFDFSHKIIYLYVSFSKYIK